VKRGGAGRQARAELEALQARLSSDGRSPLAQTALLEAQLAALGAKHEDALAKARRPGSPASGSRLRPGAMLCACRRCACCTRAPTDVPSGARRPP